jgi:ABC-type sugar transport system ATPase subunit
VSLDPKWRQLAGGGTRRVVLGIRPEDLEVAPQGHNAPGDGVITARVDLVELLGGEALVHLTSAGVELTAQGARARAIQHQRLGTGPSARPIACLRR